MVDQGGFYVFFQVLIQGRHGGLQAVRRGVSTGVSAGVGTGVSTGVSKA